MQNNDKKALLRISNLKQYFPLKGGRFVKANDGISLDIYEGETFGLVGESGCGKSTLGRTILQLYHQTYGRTMYYGRSLDDLAPKYVIDTVKTSNHAGPSSTSWSRSAISSRPSTPSSPKRSSMPSTPSSTPRASWPRTRCSTSQRSSAASSWSMISIP